MGVWARPEAWAYCRHQTDYRASTDGVTKVRNAKEKRYAVLVVYTDINKYEETEFT